MNLGKGTVVGYSSGSNCYEMGQQFESFFFGQKHAKLHMDKQLNEADIKKAVIL